MTSFPFPNEELSRRKFEKFYANVTLDLSLSFTQVGNQILQ